MSLFKIEVNRPTCCTGVQV